MEWRSSPRLCSESKRRRFKHYLICKNLLNDNQVPARTCAQMASKQKKRIMCIRDVILTLSNCWSTKRIGCATSRCNPGIWIRFVSFKLSRKLEKTFENKQHENHQTTRKGSLCLNTLSNNLMVLWWVHFLKIKFWGQVCCIRCSKCSSNPGQREIATEKSPKFTVNTNSGLFQLQLLFLFKLTSREYTWCLLRLLSIFKS